IPHGNVEALAEPRLKPQIRISSCIILRQNHPVRPIEGTLPNAADIARDANLPWSPAKPVQSNMPVRIAIGRKLVPGTDIILSSHTQINRIEPARQGRRWRRVGRGGSHIDHVRIRILRWTTENCLQPEVA